MRPLPFVRGLALAALCSVPCVAQDAALSPAGWAGELAAIPLDASVLLDDARSPLRGDPRDNLALFACHPTVVVYGNQKLWTELDIKPVQKVLKRFDKLAATWNRRGVESILLLRRPSWAGLDKPVPLLEGARLKACVNAYKCFHLFERGRTDCWQDVVLDAWIPEQFGLRWLLLDDAGALLGSGDDVFDGRLERALAALPAPAWAGKRPLEDAIARLTVWDLGGFRQRMDKLRAAADADAAVLDAMDQQCDRAVARYRAAFVAPHLSARRLPEAELALRRLAGWARGAGVLQEQIEKDLAELQARPDYAEVVRQRAEVDAIIALYEKQSEASSAAYNEALRRSGRTGYDSALSARFDREFLPVVEKRMRAFLAQHRDSPYRRFVLDELETVVSSQLD